MRLQTAGSMLSGPSASSTVRMPPVLVLVWVEEGVELVDEEETTLGDEEEIEELETDKDELDDETKLELTEDDEEDLAKVGVLVEDVTTVLVVGLCAARSA